MASSLAVCLYYAGVLFCAGARDRKARRRPRAAPPLKRILQRQRRAALISGALQMRLRGALARGRLRALRSRAPGAKQTHRP